MTADTSSTSLVGHIPALRRYARSLTGDAWAADDLVQDTLERACARWQLWAAGSDLRAWLFTLMHNLFVDAARQATRQAGHGHRVDVDDVANELVGSSGVPDQAMDLQRCLLRLPPEQREVLLLVSLQDLGYEEVARIVGVPVGTVMSRLSRARARLRELMEGGAGPVAAAAPTLRLLK
ncbi:MAG: polymerase sigma factor [Ramlibacter sp.]|nr:polymerase sigma factor [Ramlibacter sp.]